MGVTVGHTLYVEVIKFCQNKQSSRKVHSCPLGFDTYTRIIDVDITKHASYFSLSKVKVPVWKFHQSVNSFVAGPNSRIWVLLGRKWGELIYCTDLPVSLTSVSHTLSARCHVTETSCPRGKEREQDRCVKGWRSRDLLKDGMLADLNQPVNS